MQFYLKFCSKQSNLTASEPILLRYSTNGGIHWNLIGRYDARAFTEPKYVVVNIPYGAKTNSTRVQWWQPVSDHSHRVDWAVDQVNKLFAVFECTSPLPSALSDNIRVMVIIWRLRGNIIRTALCWIVWHNVHSPQHTYMSSSHRSNSLALLHCDPYAVRRGVCLELYYYNMVEWFWWDSSLISTTKWFPSVLWHCWFGHLACKNRPWNEL